MKRPLSPTHLLENGGMCTSSSAYLGAKEPRGGHTHLQKKLLFSLCEVCNIQLNSAAQAQVHYNGKSHLRRVKQLNNGEVPPAPGPAPLASISTANAAAPSGRPVQGFAGDNRGWCLTPQPTRSSSQGLSMLLGSSCHSTALPALVRTPSLMMQSALDIKPFMSFPVDATSPVGLFPNFNTMDPVQKAVINHTFGVSVPAKKKQVISCGICQLRFNSDSQAEAHYKGSKHAKKLKAQDSTKNKQKSAPTRDSAKTIATTTTVVTASNSDQPEKSMAPPNGPKASVPPEAPVPTATVAPAAPCLSNAAPEPVSASPPPDTAAQGGAARNGTKPAPVPAPLPAPAPAESEEEKAKKLLYCSLCKVAVNSLSQLEAHNTGSKHKTMLEARNGAGPIKAYPRPGSKLKVQATVIKGSGLQNKTFHCEICDVHVNSEIQLKQHISSRRHKDRVAGKPLKPKYSPYSKQQRSSTVLAAKLALQKDLVKPLSPSFISGPFSATAVPSMALHPRAGAPLFQTALPPSFLRAAPGPMRPTAGSAILFAPY